MITIETAVNGYVIRADEEVWTVANDNEAEATFEMLGHVLELIGHIGSRYDEWRVGIKLEHGDKWISQEEAKELFK